MRKCLVDKKFKLNTVLKIVSLLYNNCFHEYVENVLALAYVQM